MKRAISKSAEWPWEPEWPLRWPTCLWGNLKKNSLNSWKILRIKLPLNKRYIDDIFVFAYSEEKLQEFMNFMNSEQRTIKLTEEHSSTEVVFQECRIKQRNDSLYTILNVKETATHSYVCDIPGRMLWDGSGCRHVCVWECVRLMFQLLTQVLFGLLAGYCCAKWLNFTLPYSLYRISKKKSDTMQDVQFCILFNSIKYSVFKGVDILIVFVPKKDEVYCTIFRKYLRLLSFCCITVTYTLSSAMLATKSTSANPKDLSSLGGRNTPIPYILIF